MLSGKPNKNVSSSVPTNDPRIHVEDEDAPPPPKGSCKHVKILTVALIKKTFCWDQI